MGPLAGRLHYRGGPLDIDFEPWRLKRKVFEGFSIKRPRVLENFLSPSQNFRPPCPPEAIFLLGGNLLSGA